MKRAVLASSPAKDNNVYVCSKLLFDFDMRFEGAGQVQGAGTARPFQLFYSTTNEYSTRRVRLKPEASIGLNFSQVLFSRLCSPPISRTRNSMHNGETISMLSFTQHVEKDETKKEHQWENRWFLALTVTPTPR